MRVPKILKLTQILLLVLPNLTIASPSTSSCVPFIIQYLRIDFGTGEFEGEALKVRYSVMDPDHYDSQEDETNSPSDSDSDERASLDRRGHCTGRGFFTEDWKPDPYCDELEWTTTVDNGIEGEIDAPVHGTVGINVCHEVYDDDEDEFNRCHRDFPCDPDMLPAIRHLRCVRRVIDIESELNCSEGDHIRCDSFPGKGLFAERTDCDSSLDPFHDPIA